MNRTEEYIDQLVQRANDYTEPIWFDIVHGVVNSAEKYHIEFVSGDDLSKNRLTRNESERVVADLGTRLLEKARIIPDRPSLSTYNYFAGVLDTDLGRKKDITYAIQQRFCWDIEIPFLKLLWNKLALKTSRIISKVNGEMSLLKSGEPKRMLVEVYEQDFVRDATHIVDEFRKQTGHNFKVKWMPKKNEKPKIPNEVIAAFGCQLEDVNIYFMIKDYLMQHSPDFWTLGGKEQIFDSEDHWHTSVKETGIGGIFKHILEEPIPDRHKYNIIRGGIFYLFGPRAKEFQKHEMVKDKKVVVPRQPTYQFIGSCDKTVDEIVKEMSVENPQANEVLQEVQRRDRILRGVQPSPETFQELTRDMFSENPYGIRDYLQAPEEVQENPKVKAAYEKLRQAVSEVSYAVTEILNFQTKKLARNTMSRYLLED